jgi:hypothetical protein
MWAVITFCDYGCALLFLLPHTRFLECLKEEALRPSCDSCLLECQRTLWHIILAPQDLCRFSILLSHEFFTSHFFLAEIQWEVILSFYFNLATSFSPPRSVTSASVSESISKSAMALTLTIIPFYSALPLLQLHRFNCTSFLESFPILGYMKFWVKALKNKPNVMLGPVSSGVKDSILRLPFHWMKQIFVESRVRNWFGPSCF